MDIVDILRKLMRAEHAGNFALHIVSISEMFPFMAASPHNLYTNSRRIYVKTNVQMCKLQVEHPDVYNIFEEGYHVIR